MQDVMPTCKQPKFKQVRRLIFWLRMMSAFHEELFVGVTATVSSKAVAAAKQKYHLQKFHFEV